MTRPERRRVDAASGRCDPLAADRRWLSTRPFQPPLFEHFDHRVFIGELARLQFGVYEIVVDAHFETSAPGGNQEQAANLLFECGQDFRRQTDGFGFVVSNGAVLQSDVHE